VEGLDSGGGGSLGSPILPRHYYTTTMELESDIYDVVVIGTGLAQSIAAA
jgi:hypothetical protein